MRSRLALATLALATLACHHEPSTPAGTVLVDWAHPGSDGEAPPSPKSPPENVAADEALPSVGTPDGKLHFEIEIGQSVDHDGLRWNVPRHARITLVGALAKQFEPTTCLTRTAGNKVENTIRKKPDGSAIGLVSCLVSLRPPLQTYRFDIDGEGKITRVFVD